MLSTNRLPRRLVVVAGTYDGVLAGWDTVSHESREVGEGEDGAPGGAGSSSKRQIAGTPKKKGRADDDGEDEEEDDSSYLKMSFAMAVHEGSVRCLSISSAPPSHQKGGKGGGDGGDDEKAKKRKKNKKRRKDRDDDGDDGDDGGANDDDDGRAQEEEQPGTLLSAGYDESIAVYNLSKHVQAGELKSPADLGTPTCSSFAPPAGSSSPATHALIGLSSGKLVLYKKRDWSVQHVLSGHESEHGGVNCLAVHPTGRMALSGGRGDGRVVLWDLTRGRLAFVHKLPSAGRRRKTTVTDLAWSEDGNRYALATDGGKVTARDVATGEDLLDVVLPSRANQIAFVGGPEGLFLAAACDDGCLPLLAVGSVADEEEAKGTRRAIMAIEPVDGPTAGDGRFKCLRSVKGGGGFLAVTANSGGVVSLIDLEGAARMILSDEQEEERGDGGGAGGRGSRGENDGEDKVPSSSSDDEGEDEDDEVAVEFLESVRVGSGARITSIAVWSCADQDGAQDFGGDAEDDAVGSESVDAEVEEEESDEGETERKDQMGTKRKASNMNGRRRSNEVEMDSEAVAKARALVSQAKKRQRKEKQKKEKMKSKNA